MASDEEPTEEDGAWIVGLDGPPLYVRCTTYGPSGIPVPIGSLENPYDLPTSDTGRCREVTNDGK